jgi:UDP-glucuronate decarboxylase
MLGLAKRLDVPILQASTSEVYGDPNISPQSEEYWGNVNPIGLRACYDEGKRVAETLCFDYNRQYGVQTKVVRIFNTYGPSMQFDDGRVVSNFILQALTNRNITIYGDGSQTRSFCYVSDLVEGLIKMIETPSQITGPINLGNPNEMTILSLAETIIKLTNSNSKIVKEDLPSDDPRQRQPDISKAERILNWKPVVSLDAGLKETIEDFTKRLKGHKSESL